MWRTLDKIPPHLFSRQCTSAVTRGTSTKVIGASSASFASTFLSHYFVSKRDVVVNARRFQSSTADDRREEITDSTGNGYLGKILNAKVYDVAVETELQHAKNLSKVCSFILCYISVRFYCNELMSCLDSISDDFGTLLKVLQWVKVFVLLSNANFAPC